MNCSSIPFAGKDFRAWKRFHEEDINATVAILRQSTQQPVSATDIIQVPTGGAVRHTFAHPQIALAVGQWISPAFGAAIRSLTGQLIEGSSTAAEGRQEASDFLNSLRTDDGKVFQIDLDHNGFVDVTKLCKAEGVLSFWHHSPPDKKPGV